MQRFQRLRILAYFIANLYFLFATGNAFAQVINLNANSLLPHAAVFFSPAAQTIIQGSTFDVSVYLNTYKNSANAVDLTIQFPENLLAVVQPATGNSVVGIWVQPPSYSNTNGTIHLTGVVPNGITTGGGLVTTVTFRALAPGNATVKISDASTILSNDGQGTQMATEFGQGSYTITPTPPAGVTIFSVTHPFSSQWYNNNSPILSWNNDQGNSAFSYLLDDKPFTAPADLANTTGTSVSFQDLDDSVWYFHVKALNNGVWGATTNFLLKIDTQPPAEFTPAVQVTDVPNKKALISFFTTDNLSGINHYEIGAIDDGASSTESPVFIEVQSPYTFALSQPGSNRATVIVRAIDNAGNVRDESVDVVIPTPFGLFIQNNSLPIALGTLILVLMILLIHYFFGHKIIPRAQRLFGAIEKEDRLEKIAEAQAMIDEIKKEESESMLPPTPGGDARGQ